MSSWTNRCGGGSWRTRDDGTIELQGGEVPLWGPTDAQFQLLLNSWQNWRRLIRRAARQQGLPPSWLLAFINAETGAWSADPAVQADCGPWSTRCRNTCCAGLMQVMVTPYPNYKTFGGYDRPEDMRDPWKAIDTGAKMLARMVTKSGGELPAMASSYNQGPGDGRVHCPGGAAHACASSAWAMCSDPGYITRVVTGNNTAILVLGTNRALGDISESLILAGAVAAAVAGASVLGPVLFGDR